MAIDKEHPVLNFTFQLQEGKYLIQKIAGTQTVIAAIPLADCLSLPGISDGTLFKKM